MSTLASIQRGGDRLARRTLIYGPGGIGKSSFAALAPSPIFVQLEDGLADIAVDRFPLATSLDDALDQLDGLLREEHPYQTVVLDSVDWLERLVWSQVCRDRKVQTIEDVPYGRGYVFAITHWQRVLEQLDWLRSMRGMAVILIAHAAIEKVANPDTDSYDRFAPRLNKHASALVQEWCDEVLFATYRIRTKTVSEGFARTRTQGIGSGERVLRTSERPAFVAKNRCGLPDEIPLDFDIYAAHVRGELPTQAPAEDSVGNGD